MSGYSGTPLDRKLGLKAGMRVLFIGLPDHLAGLKAVEGLAEVLTEWPVGTPGARLDYIHVFETGRGSLETMMPRLLALVAPAGMIWISWPKRASKVPTSITEDVLREIFLPTGLVDVKVCAVDETWSGLKFVVRKDLRNTWPET
ncbi:hypothetical protein [Rhizobium sp. RU36D]|uniref:hypothetical protein n=1 Tax=Rhizobium sp. RU36D TaxID=1907415 RepID=UPI0009D7C381|nr:hypothetical protein [Rhizobium sp. RU36D]SMD03044.1 hypothetical protein SAMN05880593_11676 [Rhizobium sp. RU36D]